MLGLVEVLPVTTVPTSSGRTSQHSEQIVGADEGNGEAALDGTGETVGHVEVVGRADGDVVDGTGEMVGLSVGPAKRIVSSSVAATDGLQASAPSDPDRVTVTDEAAELTKLVMS